MKLKLTSIFCTLLLSCSAFAAYVPLVDNGERVAVIDITASQINSMYSTPITLIPDPGAGKMVAVEYVTISYTYGGTQFTGGGTMRVSYNGSSITILNALQIDSLITAGTSSFIRSYGMPLSTGGITPIANKAVELTCASANFATGDGTMRVYMKYRIITL